MSGRMRFSNIVHVNLVPSIAIAVLIELEPDALISFVAVSIRFVDLCVGRQFSVRFETACLVRGIFQNDIALLVLEVPKRDEDNIALVDPDLLSQFSTNVRQPLFTIKALRKQVSYSP